MCQLRLVGRIPNLFEFNLFEAMKKFFVLGLVFCSILLLNTQPTYAQEAEAGSSDEAGLGAGSSWEDTPEESEAKEQEIADQQATQAADSTHKPPKEASLAGHLLGFAISLVYFIGGGLVIYYGRKHWLYRKLSPELLVVLHIFWPVQLVLFLFFSLPQFAKIANRP